ncbi:DNA-binding response regulator [Coprococcus eutactus]|jgi:two-component system response regulator ArlR|uniref:Stage 0 sporulation protein A homolog n=1 Tax=Coprococcus eutactus TaxID=33043 RepID=A0A3R5ZN43_9FIRM|nr:DNA-binding response regulator [Coprococcus eutactus]
MRLLLAEDEKALSSALQVILKHNNYSVDAVYNGQDAYDYIVAGVYDGVILDVMMPKMDGFTVLSKIRSEGCDVPVIMLTAKSETDDKINGLDLGADDYLAKPFEMKELLARIRAITRRKSEAVSADMIYGDCTLNSLNYELSSDGGSVKLQNKEYQIMELLMANQKSIISAELMMEKIWGYDTDTEISVVWVNISYLRKKLGQIGSKVSIKAVRNQGYTLEYSE